ncbi:MAG: M14 family metallopeptidase [Bacteroidota bacterium]
MKKGLLYLGLWVLIGCSAEKQPTTQASAKAEKIFHVGDIWVDHHYKGAGLNELVQLDDSSYQALILPEASPINNSPWFGFKLWSEAKRNIQLDIKYEKDYKHRYVPKISTDGRSWQAIPASHYKIDSVLGKVSLRLEVGPKKLWISAQENIHSGHIQAWMDSLITLEGLTKETIGKSVLGQPIDLLKIKRGNPSYSLVLIGRQHPPEVPGGTLSLMAFVHSLLDESALAQQFIDHFEIIIAPLLNPDGVDKGYWRFNANHKDLNRDWVEFSQPETQAVRNWIKQYPLSNPQQKYCFAIDFHTSYSGPYLLVIDTSAQAPPQPITSKWIQRIESTSQDSLDIRPRPQSLPYCYNWFINEIGIEAVTYEEGDEIDRAIIKRRAEDYARALMEVLIEELTNLRQ